MEYSICELLFFLFFYSFLGWCLEVLYMAIKTGKFCNRGLFNLPLSLSYGIAMDILLIVMPTLEGAYLLWFAACMVVTSVCAQIASEVSVRLTGQSLWEQEIRSVYSGRGRGFLTAVALSAAAIIIILLIHPVVFLLCQMIPPLVLLILTIGLSALAAVDFLAVLYTVRKIPVTEGMQYLAEELQERKEKLGERMSRHIWRRLKKAYPNLHAADRADDLQKKDVFARGLCLDKLIWIFFIGALGGDIIETFYVRFTAGIWMSRTSVLYGTFSIVWGAGAALLTLLLHGLSGKEDRYIFLGGFFLGGFYEYMCSVFTEVFFGTTFWDYSDMPFNIGGRTNLLFCIFWGILSLVWVKICYPPLSRRIEKIPPLPGKILTWTCVALMTCDMLISGLAMVRYVERAQGTGAETAVERFLDHYYPDSFIEWTWPNLIIE